MADRLTDEQFTTYVDQLEDLIRGLDPAMRGHVRRHDRWVEADIRPVDPRRPTFSLSASQQELTFWLGRMGDDDIAATAANFEWLLAIVEAVRDGRTRVVHLREPLDEAYVAFLTTRGLREFAWIAQGAVGTRRFKAGERPVRSYPVTGWLRDSAI